MAVEIRVPGLGESVVEATIAQWLKKPGDMVAIGDALVELETDKVNQSIEAESAGILGEITRKEGDTVAINEVIGILSENATANGSSSPAATATPIPIPPNASVTTTESQAEHPTAPDGSTNGSAPAVAVTPVAQRIAQDNNIDLSQVKGSGPGGRIVKDDVADAMQGKTATPVPVTVKSEATPAPAVKETTPTPATPTASVSLPPKPAVPVSQSGGRPEIREKMTRRRAVIAAHLLEAKQATAMLTTFKRVRLDRDYGGSQAAQRLVQGETRRRFGLYVLFHEGHHRGLARISLFECRDSKR